MPQQTVPQRNDAGDSPAPLEVRRVDVQQALRGLGFDLTDLASLECGRDELVGTFYARNAKGARYLNQERTEAVTYETTTKVLW